MTRFIALILATLLTSPWLASAQDASVTLTSIDSAAAESQSKPARAIGDLTPDGPIQDNSFLLEEAYNQEDGVIQHISFFQRLSGTRDWVYTMTDEWPIRTQKHQLSVTLAATHSGSFGGHGFGDTLLNYRYQLIGSGETKYAFAPRLSAVLPSGNHRFGRGFGGAGLQTNLPFSIQHNSRLTTHWNAGATWIPGARNDFDQKARTVGVNLGQSFIYAFNKRVNAMLETVWTSNEDVVAVSKTVRAQDLYLNPGVRWSHNFRSGLQIVPGVSVPIGVGPSAGEKGVIVYLSFEHPFGFARSK